ncbi:MAG: hypothetical protein J5374_07650 [Bacteroidales bacterium]|nr:hypothetical protein [Bacteroidales bacterium]
MEKREMMSVGTRPMTFAEKESICEFRFKQEGPFWHLTTPGMFQEILFISDDDFHFGMSSTAICAAETGIVIYAHTLMGNHVHDIVSCTRDRCLQYMSRRRERLKRYLKSLGREVDLGAFECEPIPITSLKMLRNEIVYVHRNGYVVHPEHTPFSYPWGTGAYYFNPLSRSDTGVLYSSLTYKAKREIFHGRIIELPVTYRFKNGFFFPPSYCKVTEGEGMFRDAHQYFSLLSKNVEAYSEEARRLGDTVVLTDEEMYPAMQMECRKRFGARRPAEISMKEKVELARVMHEDYAASNSQIQRILNLDLQTVSSLYPLKARR